MSTKILLVEDDPSVVEAVKLLFNIYWSEAVLICAVLGKEGVKLAETEKPDAVILDLGLPDISGFEVLKSIRLFTSIPVIVLTAHTAEDEIVKALEEEATDYVTKPFKHRELIARVQSHLTRYMTNEIRSSLHMQDNI
jgi:DNA-binding response OmpR family regulator